MKEFIRKDPDRDFSSPEIQKLFVGQAQSYKSLLQKEIDVNLAEQNLLKKRISTMKELINDLPSIHPQYSVLTIQIEVDEIELNELQLRSEQIKSLLMK